MDTPELPQSRHNSFKRSFDDLDTGEASSSTLGMASALLDAGQDTSRRDRHKRARSDSNSPPPTISVAHTHISPDSLSSSQSSNPSAPLTARSSASPGHDAHSESSMFYVSQLQDGTGSSELLDVEMSREQTEESVEELSPSTSFINPASPSILHAAPESAGNRASRRQEDLLAGSPLAFRPDMEVLSSSRHPVPATPATDSSNEDRFRISMERYSTFDEHISVLRASQPTQAASSPPIVDLSQTHQAPNTSSPSLDTSSHIPGPPLALVSPFEHDLDQLASGRRRGRSPEHVLSNSPPALERRLIFSDNAVREGHDSRGFSYSIEPGHGMLTNWVETDFGRPMDPILGHTFSSRAMNIGSNRISDGISRDYLAERAREVARARTGMDALYGSMSPRFDWHEHHPNLTRETTLGEEQPAASGRDIPTTASSQSFLTRRHGLDRMPSNLFPHSRHRRTTSEADEAEAAWLFNEMEDRYHAANHDTLSDAPSAPRRLPSFFPRAHLESYRPTAVELASPVVEPIPPRNRHNHSLGILQRRLPRISLLDDEGIAEEETVLDTLHPPWHYSLDSLRRDSESEAPRETASSSGIHDMYPPSPITESLRPPSWAPAGISVRLQGALHRRRQYGTGETFEEWRRRQSEIISAMQSSPQPRALLGREDAVSSAIRADSSSAEASRPPIGRSLPRRPPRPYEDEDEVELLLASGQSARAGFSRGTAASRLPEARANLLRLHPFRRDSLSDQEESDSGWPPERTTDRPAAAHGPPALEPYSPDFSFEIDALHRAQSAAPRRTPAAFTASSISQAIGSAPGSAINLDRYHEGPFRASLARSERLRREREAGRQRASTRPEPFRSFVPPRASPLVVPIPPSSSITVDPQLTVHRSTAIGGPSEVRRSASQSDSANSRPVPGPAPSEPLPSLVERAEARAVRLQQLRGASRRNDREDIHQSITRRVRTPDARVAGPGYMFESDTLPGMLPDASANGPRQQRLIDVFHTQRMSSQSATTRDSWGDLDEPPSDYIPWRPAHRASRYPLPMTHSTEDWSYERQSQTRPQAHRRVLHTRLGRRTDRENGLHSRTMGDYIRDEDFDTSYEGLLRLTSIIGEARPRGTPRDIIDGLPKGTYSDWAVSSSEKRCPICLDDYEQSDPVLKIPKCSHWFHRGCLEQWLGGASSCPVCRGPIDPNTTTTETRPSRSHRPRRADSTRSPRASSAGAAPANPTPGPSAAREEAQRRLDELLDFDEEERDLLFRSLRFLTRREREQ